MTRYTTLLNFSGGIDSLWCLWNYARRQEPLLVHYCHLVNWTGRGAQEKKAVDCIMTWLDEHLPFDYRLIQTRFDYGDVAIVQDKEVLGFLTGVILRDHRNQTVNRLIVCSNNEDVSRFPYYVSTEADRFRLIEAVARKRVEYVYPIAGKTKADLIRELPADLLALAWWCRTPKGEEPCRTCRTCKKVFPVLEEIEA